MTEEKQYFELNDDDSLYLGGLAIEGVWDEDDELKMWIALPGQEEVEEGGEYEGFLFWLTRAEVEALYLHMGSMLS